MIIEVDDASKRWFQKFKNKHKITSDAQAFALMIFMLE